MTDLTPNTHDATGMPRWVKISLLLVAALIVLFVALKLTGAGGQHGPARHVPGGGAPSGVTEDGGHRPPPGIPDHRG